MLALAAVLAAVPAVRVRAADESTPPPPPPNHERMQEAGDRLVKALGLSDDQKAKWKAIGEQERAELDALRADTSVAKEDRRAKAMAIHDKYRAQRDAILTPEQKAKADKFRARMEKRRGEHGPGGPGGPGGDKPADGQ